MLRVVFMAVGWGFGFCAGGIFSVLSFFALANTPGSQYDVIGTVFILVVSGALTGFVGGFAIGLALQESLRARMTLSSFLEVVCGWTLALVLALNVGYLLSYVPGISTLSPISVAWTVGLGLGGAAAGSLTARFVERVTHPLGSPQILRIAATWGLALSVGAGAIFGFKIGDPIVIGIFGAVAGGIGGAVLLWETGLLRPR